MGKTAVVTTFKNGQRTAPLDRFRPSLVSSSRLAFPVDDFTLPARDKSPHTALERERTGHRRLSPNPAFVQRSINSKGRSSLVDVDVGRSRSSDLDSNTAITVFARPRRRISDGTVEDRRSPGSATAPRLLRRAAPSTRLSRDPTSSTALF